MNSFHDTLIRGALADGVGRHVVAAVVMDADRVLLLRRKKDDFLGELYELPGGAVESGESIDAALRRELEEEIGGELAEIGDFVGSFDYRAKSGILTRQFTFVARLVSSSMITLTEHDMFVWAAQEELPQFNVSSEVRNQLRAAWGISSNWRQKN